MLGLYPYSSTSLRRSSSASLRALRLRHKKMRATRIRATATMGTTTATAMVPCWLRPWLAGLPAPTRDEDVVDAGALLVVLLEATGGAVEVL